MRGKFLRFFLLIAAVMCLASCTRVLNSPADELRLYAWEYESDNGSCVSLQFDDTNAYLTIENDTDSLTLSGLCIATDDRLTICDDDSGLHYSFCYQLYGDRVELSVNGGVLSLEKQLPS